MSLALDQLVAVMKRLRNPKDGCPWDIKQTFQSLVSDTLEETYEVVEAIENNDLAHLKEELGDLLLQVVFHAQMADEQGLFSFDDVAKNSADKMVERHPHVFGDRQGVDTADKVVQNWDADKAEKKLQAALGEGRRVSALDDVNTALPAMTRALKLQKRAANVGFDWKNPDDVIAKIHEEADELAVEIKAGLSVDNHDRIEDEFGDVLFVLVNMARHLKLDPETALRRTNRKFERRFRSIEDRLAACGRDMKDASLDEMEALWQEIKKEERASQGAVSRDV